MQIASLCANWLDRNIAIRAISTSARHVGMCSALVPWYWSSRGCRADCPLLGSLFARPIAMQCNHLSMLWHMHLRSFLHLSTRACTNQLIVLINPFEFIICNYWVILRFIDHRALQSGHLILCQWNRKWLQYFVSHPPCWSLSPHYDRTVPILCLLTTESDSCWSF